MLRLRMLGLALVVSALALAAGPAAAADGFFDGVDDLPLMPGMAQADGGALVFESPAGRIVEVYAAGAVTRRQILDFYAETLPQLGWNPAGEGLFRREGEVLALDFPAAAGGPVTVHIVVKPADAPPPP